METETVTGYVDHIIYRNAENGYTVLVLVVNEEELTCVGTFSDIAEGENIEAHGEYTEHATYGRQFKVVSFEEKEPEDEMAIERYLGSGAIHGIGLALAARIVRRFKKDTFRIIEEEPERLAEVKGISQRKAMEIADQVNAKRDLREAMIFLQQYGINMNLAVKIYNKYGGEIYSVLKENPYRMADDIDGVGFKTADEIAARVGIKTDSDFRIKSGIQYVLQQAAMDGHTYLPMEELTRRAVYLLGVESSQVEAHYMNLAMDRKIVMQLKDDITQIYANTFYYMEANTAAMLKQLDVTYDVPDIEIEAAIRNIEKKTEMELDEHQAEAVKEAVRNGLLVITGGPGTGKTTTINTIIKYFELEGMDIFLAAPTGRAAKRMSETTGWEAQTIHRLLELNGGVNDDDKSGMHFERNKMQPLEADVLIVDEFSMVDIYLLNALLNALVPGCRLIIVGDVNQLPSVGPGNVLRDMIQSEFCNVVRLNQIYRQEAKSQIVVNAHKINAGEAIALDNQSVDFFHLERYKIQDIINVVIQLVMKNMPSYVDASPYDIQVLAPMRKGELGVENLNKILQRFVNPQEMGKKEREFHGVLFREQDKIMQIKNDYQMKWKKVTRFGDVYEEGTGVFNGDVGIIQRIYETEEVVEVEFEEGKMVEYDFSQMDEMELAYAITIHKSQGSEYPAVVIPILGGPRMLMNRNLLYTAVTRAKKCVTLVGSRETVYQMIGNVHEQKRYSGLCQRIHDRMLEEQGEC